ncbi:hypothetical protein [Ammoniphilus sp. 3BR4]
METVVYSLICVGWVPHFNPFVTELLRTNGARSAIDLCLVHSGT